jgi:hypothetical protein
MRSAGGSCTRSVAYKPGSFLARAQEQIAAHESVGARQDVIRHFCKRTKRRGLARLPPRDARRLLGALVDQVVCGPRRSRSTASYRPRRRHRAGVVAAPILRRVESVTLRSPISSSSRRLAQRPSDFPITQRGLNTRPRPPPRIPALPDGRLANATVASPRRAAPAPPFPARRPSWNRMLEPIPATSDSVGQSN